MLGRHRLTLHAEKASAAKQRKERKKAKNDPTWRSKLSKDPGVPNLFPFKDKILKEIEENKRRKEEDAARRREQQKEQRAAAIATRTGGADPDALADDIEEESRDVEDEAMDEEVNTDGSRHVVPC